MVYFFSLLLLSPFFSGITTVWLDINETLGLSAFTNAVFD